MSSKVHSLNSLMTRSINPIQHDNDGVEINQQDGNVVIVCKPSNIALKGLLKKDKTDKQKLKQQQKVFRFAQPLTQIHFVENWKKYNHNLEEEKETCCKLF